MSRNRYLLIGPVPPPLGGISVYVYRLARELRAGGEPVDVVDPTRLGRLARLRLALSIALGSEPLELYLNGPSLVVMSAVLLRRATARVTYHDHNDRALERMGGIGRAIFARFLARADEVRLVAEEVRGYHARHGIRLDPARTVVRNAFLPPPPEDEAAIRETYDAETRRFVEERRPLLVANAFRLVREGGVDVYGLDLCVDLVSALSEEHPRLGLLFALAEVGEPAYLEEIRRRIAERGLGERIHILGGQRELWPLFRTADLLVRPTSTDGFPLSVAEAQYFGCRVVASDVCARPTGVRVFKSRDLSDLVARCREALAEGRR